MESDTPRTDSTVINVEYETREPDGEPSQVIEEVVLADFARQLERELAAMQKQRDEARRDACAFESIIPFSERRPRCIVWTLDVRERSKAIATQRGWDCFKEGGGA